MSLLHEAELHGLVDGHLDVDRRADVLRRLGASAADRARVETWQEQNDLIRAAFLDVEREALPVALDLAPPRLRCLEGGGVRPSAPARGWRQGRRAGYAAGLAAAVVIAVGLVGSWLLIEQATHDDGAADGQPRGALDETLATRTATAVDTDARSPAGQASSLPITRIPDLSTAGFILTSASTEPTKPAALVFRYRDGGTGRLAISIARNTAAAPSDAPIQIGRSFIWHRRDAAFALAGTLGVGRLREIAVSLQSNGGDD